MSTALGIASVTHVLKDLLNDGLINNVISTAVGTDVKVSSLQPSLVEASSGATDTQLNLFLYRVSPNTGWVNNGYPSRNGRGDLIGNPPLALNLHYLLSAFGDSELHAEILLGYGMQLLHETPVLERAVIRRSLTPTVGVSTLPENLRELATSELAEQIEQIKITPEPINTEEVSKLWTAFQSRYRPCTAYLATVVLIESDLSTRSALPVLEPRSFAVPFSRPSIEKIMSQKNPETSDDPILENQKIFVGSKIYIKGQQLGNDNVLIKINGEDFIPNNASDTEISLVLPDTLKAGLQGVQIIQQVDLTLPNSLEANEGVLEIIEHESILRRGAESNLLAFVLSPQITNITVETPIEDDDLYSADIAVSINPRVYSGQRTKLLLNQISNSLDNPISYSFLVPASSPVEGGPPLAEMTFPVESIRAGTYLVRIQVDGAESPLLTDDEGVYNGPQITIS